MEKNKVKKWKKEVEKKKKSNQLTMVFLIFLIGSIVGYIIETIVVLVQKGYLESRQGLIYGPFTPVYGIGLVLFYEFFKNMKNKNRIQVFLLSMLLGGMIEYLCSFFQEKLFGTVSWDYSNWLFNINGRTTLIHCTYWGIGGLIYFLWLEPVLPKIELRLKKYTAKVLITGIAIFMIFNIAITYMAAIRQKCRMQNIAPQNRMDEFLDKEYPNEYMDIIFANKKEVI